MGNIFVYPRYQPTTTATATRRSSDIHATGLSRVDAESICDVISSHFGDLNYGRGLDKSSPRGKALAALLDAQQRLKEVCWYDETSCELQVLISDCKVIMTTRKKPSYVFKVTMNEDGKTSIVCSNKPAYKYVWDGVKFLIGTVANYLPTVLKAITQGDDTSNTK